MSKAKEISLFLLSNPEFVQWVIDPNQELDIYWNNWLQAHREHFNEVKKARELILGLHHKPLEIQAEVKSRVLLNVLAHDKTKSGSFIPHPSLNKEWNIWLSIKQGYKVAMILILICLLGYLINQFALPDRLVQKPENLKPSFITKTTNFGEKLNFKLPDGTNVWLNSGSQLTFPDEFDSLERRVVLKGEGYFDVKEDEISVFKVVSGNLETEALGTSFNINFLNPEKVLVSLIDGKVKIQYIPFEESYLLAPGEQLQYYKTNKDFKITKFNTEMSIDWKEGLLSFKNAKFQEVVASLERWYGVQIRVSGKPSSPWSLSGKYKNQTLDLVLDRMSFVETFKYEINGKNVHLKFK
jgi:hypothetical protein